MRVDKDLQQQDDTTLAESQAEKLPLEMLQHLISFVNVKDVTENCIRVSRKWEQASRADLRTRTHLKIGVNVCTPSPWPGFENEIFSFRSQKSVAKAAKNLTVPIPDVRYLSVSHRRHMAVEDLILSLAPFWARRQSPKQSHWKENQ